MSADIDLVKKTENKSAFAVHTSSRSPKSYIPKQLKEKRIIIGAGSVLTAIVIVGIGLYYFQQYQKNQALLTNPTAVAQKEQQAIVAKVGQLMELPSDEQPTVATVSDITKLSSQQFFQNAKNGDKVLIYPKAKEAILYDPVSNKIVRVGPVNIGGQQQSVAGASTAATPAPQTTLPPVTVAIYNGTTIVGLAKKTEAELAQKMSSATVVAEANASNSAYTQTKIVDLTGNNAASAKQLAAVLNGTVSTLPAGESKPAHADLLVILGSK